MEERDKFDLQQYTAKPVSRRYLYRILFYIALLITASIIVYKFKKKPQAIPPSSPTTEIEGITILTE